MNNYWQGKRIRLRAVEPEDAEFHYLWNQDSEMARNVDFVWPPSSREYARRGAAEQSLKKPVEDSFHFEIENLSGEAVGSISSHNCILRNGTFSYGVAVREEHLRKGYASEAILIVLRYYFEELRYQKCTVHIFSFNEACIRLHERLGFRLEGRLRRMGYTRGQYYDTLAYGITADEFAAAYPAMG